MARKSDCSSVAQMARASFSASAASWASPCSARAARSLGTRANKKQEALKNSPL